MNNDRKYLLLLARRNPGNTGNVGGPVCYLQNVISEGAPKYGNETSQNNRSSAVGPRGVAENRFTFACFTNILLVSKTILGN